jgi:hypothetical protein
MNFRPELAQAVMAGRKTVTRRLMSDNPRSPWFRGACSLKVGQTYAVCPGRGKNAIGRVRIVAVDLIDLGTMDLDEARAEGFNSVREFFEAFHGINRGKQHDAYTPVWRIAFEVAEILLCKACDHFGDDCVCWYIAEQKREEAVAA